MIRSEKQILRETLCAAVAALADKPAASARLRARLHTLPQWQSARVVFAFAPLVSEPDWRGADDGKLIAYPRIEGDAMRFWVHGTLEPGPHRVLEPVGGERAPAPDLVLVPGVAFDPACHRLGRGRGHYDRWLAGHDRCPTIGLCFACQVVAHVPCEAHDVTLDAVLTDDRLIVAGGAWR